MKNRTLYFGDNLEVLRDKVPDETFDLIYLDPPFNSKRDYNILFKEDDGVKESVGQVHAFEDTWHWTSEATQEQYHELVTQSNGKISELMQSFDRFVGHNDVQAYLVMMTARLVELHRVLKSTGSLYLHCDPTASHYLKIVLDVIFGKENFRNEIVWCYATPSGSAKQFPRKHDTIFFYSKSNDYYFESPRIPHKSGLHNTGQVFGANYGDRSDKIKEMENAGKKVEDWWVDVYPVDRVRSEMLGYPTQKPEALLERILKASSKEGDWVLDPFCGCGTTVAVSERLKRNWVGIDVSVMAINVIKRRLLDQFPALKSEVHIDGVPTDVAGARALFAKDPYQFETWAVGLVGGLTKDKKGADKGIDGYMVLRDLEHNGESVYRKGIIQVKGGHVQRNQVATLKSDVDRERADFGVFICLEDVTGPMTEEALTAGKFTISWNNREFPKIQILTVKELLEGKKLDLPTDMVQGVTRQAKRVNTAQAMSLF